MTKKLLWWVLAIVVIYGLWYGWKSGWLSNSNIPNGTGGNAPAGALSSKLTSFWRDISTEAGFANLDAGESGLVTSVGQQVGDLSQTYDENQF